MSATKTHVKRQAARISTVPLAAPQTDEAAREIVDALLRNCQSDEHVTATITQFIESSREWQNPVAELVFIARSTQRGDIAPAGCDRCELGPDIDTGEMRWAFHVTGERNGFTFATRCGCARGQWLKQRDRERPAPEVEPKKPRMERPSDTDWARRAAGERE